MQKSIQDTVYKLVEFIEALHNVKLQPYQIQLLKYMSDPTNKRTIMLNNPLRTMKSWIQMAAMQVMQAMAPMNLDAVGQPKTFIPKDFTPKATSSVKLNSHYNSKKSRKSRQKRGW